MMASGASGGKSVSDGLVQVVQGPPDLLLVQQLFHEGGVRLRRVSHYCKLEPGAASPAERKSQSQTPNPKFQTPMQDLSLAIGESLAFKSRLGFGAWDLFGIWNLGFGIKARGLRPPQREDRHFGPLIELQPARIREAAVDIQVSPIDPVVSRVVVRLLDGEDRIAQAADAGGVAVRVAAEHPVGAK